MGLSSPAVGVNAALRGVFRLGDSPEGGDEKLKTEKLRIWQSIGAPGCETRKPDPSGAPGCLGGSLGGHHRATSGQPQGHIRAASWESPEGRVRGRLKEASSSAGAAWEPDFQIFSFLHPFIYIKLKTKT
jgi:hypothetical protein